MRTVKLDFIRNTNMFGTSIVLKSKDKSVEKTIVENLNFDPFKSRDRELNTGYMFRNPKATDANWADVFRSLDGIEGKFNVAVRYNREDSNMYGILWFAEQTDAAVFAWANVENWQKWSNKEEEEALAKSKQKPQKVKVNKDGTVTVKVSVDTLEDI